MIPLRDSNPTRGTPVVTIALVAFNVLIFLGELWLATQGQLNNFITSWGVVPVELLSQPLAESPTLVSSMFLHGGWAHLLGNMLYLWVFGDNIEDRLGHARFIAFYLLAGIIAAATQVGIDPDSTIPLIGASGAIAGILGGYLLLHPLQRITTFVFRFITQVPAFIVLGFWFIYQFFSGVASLNNIDMQVGSVAFFAHIGGFVAGLITIYPFQVGLRAEQQERDVFSSSRELERY